MTTIDQKASTNGYLCTKGKFFGKGNHKHIHTHGFGIKLKFSFIGLNATSRRRGP